MTRLEAIEVEIDESVCISVENARWLLMRVKDLEALVRNPLKGHAVTDTPPFTVLIGLNLLQSWSERARVALAALDEKVPEPEGS